MPGPPHRPHSRSTVHSPNRLGSAQRHKFDRYFGTRQCGSEKPRAPHHRIGCTFFAARRRGIIAQPRRVVTSLRVAGVSISYAGRTVALERRSGNGRLRRILPVPTRSGGGRLTERTPAVQPRPGEPLLMPLRDLRGRLGNWLSWAPAPSRRRSNWDERRQRPVTLLRSATRKSAFRNRLAAQQPRQGAPLALRRQIAEVTVSAQASQPPGGACTSS